MHVWRIAADTPDYTADDLSGAGARVTGGRWNKAGTPLVYCAASAALACLETLVHLNAGGLPLNRYLVRVDIPDAVWRRAEIVSADAAPVGWDALPPGKVSLDLGERWVAGARTALLLVPSVVVPEEYNVLINPAFAGRERIVATKLRRWLYDPRFTAKE